MSLNGLRLAAALASVTMPAIGSIEAWPQRRSTGGAFGGSARYPIKGRARPAGSKLWRKAKEGKL